MEKLILAQDTSNLDDTGMSSEEMRKRNKMRRRKKAKRELSSSSASSSEKKKSIRNKENYLIQNKKVLPFSQLEKFVFSSTPLKEKSTQHIEDMIDSNIFTDAVSDNVTNIYK